MGSDLKMVKKYFYITLFIVSIVGLSLVQFQYFRIGLNLAGHQFNENMGDAIDQIKEGLSNRNELTYLIETSITGEEGNFKLSLDSVRDASSFFLKDFVSSALSERDSLRLSPMICTAGTAWSTCPRMFSSKKGRTC